MKTFEKYLASHWRT